MTSSINKLKIVNNNNKLNIWSTKYLNLDNPEVLQRFQYIIFQLGSVVPEKKGCVGVIRSHIRDLSFFEATLDNKHGNIR